MTFLTFRRLLARLHWWGGLVAMPVLLCVALSGALLAVAPWLTRLATPAPPHPGSVQLPESVLLARISSALPQGDAIASVDWGGRAGVQVLTLRSGERWVADPATGALLARWQGETLLERLIDATHEFHVRLLAGQTGQWMVDLATTMALVSVVSGLVLWWRTKRMTIANASTGRRWWRDLHDVTGIYASLVIVALSLTGILLAWEDPLYWLAGAQPSREPALPHSHASATGRAGEIGSDQWIAAATRALPGLPVLRLRLPASERSPVAVELGHAGRPGRSTVWLDRWDASVLRVDDFRTAPRAFRAHVFGRAVHTGEVAGWPTIVLVLLGSLSLAALAVTSMVSWLMRPTRASPPSSRTPPPA